MFTLPCNHSSYEKQSKQQKDCFAEDLSSEASDVEDDVWVTYDELTVADGQANIFERINQCFGI